MKEILPPPSIEQTQELFFSQSSLQEYYSQEFQNSLLFVDLSEIIRQYNYWRQELNFITPYYAIKCNPDPKIVELLAQMGCHFDCASQGEIELALCQSISPEKIIFANPIKGKSHIRFAKEKGVKKMTFDSIEEFKKIRTLYPEAQAIIRIAVDDSQSVCKFNTKFGAFPNQVSDFFQEIADMKGNVHGVSFHVGSGCRDPKTHKEAIQRAIETIQEGREFGFDMKILDIGGGYPSTDRYIAFSDIAENIREVHQEILSNFPELSDIEWIGEPGRFMVGSSHTMMSEVIGIKEDYQDRLRVYLNEGVYGSLSGIMFDYSDPVVSVYNKENSDLSHEYTLFGPTCDSLDKIGSLYLPKLSLGDKIFFWHIGDYSIASASTFNGFQLASRVYYISNPNDTQTVSQLSYDIIKS